MAITMKIGVSLAGVVSVASMLFAAPCEAGEVRVRAVSWKPGYPETPVFIHEAGGGKDGTEVKVKSFLNHEYLSVELGGAGLVFTSEADPASLEDETKVIGRVDLPAGCASGVFLFLEPIGDEPGAVKVVDDSLKSFPAGTTKVINLTSGDVRIELEGENFDCPAEGEMLISEQPVKKNNSSGMRAYKNEDDKWIQVKSGVWPHPGTKRVIRAVMLHPITKQIEIRGVRDISSPGE